jgi:hypothetical protein
MKNKYMILKKSGRYLIIDLVKVRLQSLRRRIFAWSKVVEVLTKQRGVKMAMIRLSYDFKGTMIEAQRLEVGDIRKFMQAMRQRLGIRLLAYAWVAEVHLDGTLHYHVCVVYKGYLTMPDRAFWGKDAAGRRVFYNRMWKKGCTHTEFDVRSPYYMAAYTGKSYQKDYTKLPDGYHAWAVYISDEALKIDLQIESLTKIKREIFETCSADGLSREEAWDEMKWILDYRKKCEIEQGMKWEYVGAFSDLKEIATWGVNEELMGKKMYLSIDRE